ncbi:hypothetical protein ACOME3_002774 [Neoechinorhynchus agilis]
MPKKSKISKEKLFEMRLFEKIMGMVLCKEDLDSNGYPRIADDSEDNLEVVNKVNVPWGFRGDIVEGDRQCARCKKVYSVSANNKECSFHTGRMEKICQTTSRRGVGTDYYLVHSCCHTGRYAEGCKKSNLHVPAYNPFPGEFVRSQKPGKNVPGHFPGIFALDCEMARLDVTRLTLVDHKLRTRLDIIIRPSSPIIDYNTEFSGITPELMESAIHNTDEARRLLLKHVNRDTILIGHALENDLRALRLCHERVVDTAIYFKDKPHSKFKPKLKKLARNFLLLDIQKGVNGHDSVEDALTCMKLVLKEANVQYP